MKSKTDGRKPENVSGELVIIFLFELEPRPGWEDWPGEESAQSERTEDAAMMEGAAPLLRKRVTSGIEPQITE